MEIQECNSRFQIPRLEGDSSGPSYLKAKTLQSFTVLRMGELNLQTKDASKDPNLYELVWRVVNGRQGSIQAEGRRKMLAWFLRLHPSSLEKFSHKVYKKKRVRRKRARESGIKSEAALKMSARNDDVSVLTGHVVLTLERKITALEKRLHVLEARKPRFGWRS